MEKISGTDHMRNEEGLLKSRRRERLIWLVTCCLWTAF